MHHINLLDRFCPLANHFDCDHNSHGGPAFVQDHDLDTALYLSGFGNAAMLSETEMTEFIPLFESQGALCDFDRGVRDAIIVAFEDPASHETAFERGDDPPEPAQ